MVFEGLVPFFYVVTCMYLVHRTPFLSFSEHRLCSYVYCFIPDIADLCILFIFLRFSKHLSILLIFKEKN